MRIEEMPRHFMLTLAQPGPNRAEVFTILRDRLQITALQAKGIMSHPEQVIASGGWWDVRPLADALRQADAVARMRIGGPPISAQFALDLVATSWPRYLPFRIEGYLVTTSLLSYLTTELEAPSGILVQQPELCAQATELTEPRAGGSLGYYGRAVVEGALWRGPYLPMFPGCLEACAVTLLDVASGVTLEFAV